MKRRRSRDHFPIETRWDNIQHADTRVWNMFCYMYWHMRCGIFVEFVDGKLTTFMPFANPNYENNWPCVRFEASFGPCDVRTFRREAARAFNLRREENLLPVKKWWANGGLICNVMPDNIWGQGLLPEIYDMLQRIPSDIGTRCFFINKRDRPYLRRDGKEPYPCLWGHENVPSIFEPTNKWMQYARVDISLPMEEIFAPLYSFYTDERYMDRHMPLAHDFDTIKCNNDIPWEKRIKKALFRGGATGQGVSSHDNQRIRLCATGEPHVDARLTSFNMRHKCGNDGIIRYIRPRGMHWASREIRNGMPLLRSNWMSPQRQQEYRWHVYMSGHSGADRLTRQLVSGSLLFLVESDLPQPWIYSHFDKKHNCLLVKPDLSNLSKCIQYALNNDASCKRKALRARDQTLYVLERFLNTWWH